MLILGIETSCDETAASVVKDGRKILSNVISSQIDLHKKFGGVVPEIASRKHIETINSVIDQALMEASITLNEVDVFAVTYGPGLVGALLVGVCTAKALAVAVEKPLVGVNHIQGHIAANYLESEWTPPFICLVASGGHSHIVHVKNYNEFEVLGRTRDDAAGEAFDKVARVLGIGYPGGPAVEQCATKGDRLAIRFPQTSFADNPYDFSFSGIKTAVINYISKNQPLTQQTTWDIAASFQHAVVSVLAEKSVAAAHKNDVKMCMAGGVASNRALREAVSQKNILKNPKDISYPPAVLCTDNAAMIACAGYYKFIEQKISSLNLNAVPNLKLGDDYFVL